MRTMHAPQDIQASTLVVGVGGAGGNAVSRLFGRATLDLKIICANTDTRALQSIPADHRLLLGPAVAGGHGSGANPALGCAAIKETLPEIVAALEGVKLCFIVAGVGRGTGGGAPIIAKAARDLGILTIGIVIKPFLFEGRRRVGAAETAIREMEKSADAVVVLCNDKLLSAMDPATTFRRSLEMCDEVVGDCILDLATIVDGAALKRVSLADVRSVFAARGRTVIGHGKYCRGADRAVRAAASALSNPLLEDVADGAQQLLLTISGGPDMGLFELEEAVDYIRAAIHPNAELVWGSTIHPALKGVLRVGIAAAGLPPPTDTAPLNVSSLPLRRRRAFEPRHGIVETMLRALSNSGPPQVGLAGAGVTGAPIANASVSPLNRSSGGSVSKAAAPAAPVQLRSPIDALSARSAEQLDTRSQEFASWPASTTGTASADGTVLVAAPEWSAGPATCPTRSGPRIYSRAYHSPSLFDRIYFATQSLRRRLRHPRPWIDQVAKRVTHRDRLVEASPVGPVQRVGVTAGRLFANAATA